MKLKALLVDDDYHARQALRHALSDVSSVEIVGEAASAGEALALINALDYQIVFMETSLPDMNGLELANIIQGLREKPWIIFVTAYSEYAVSAFAVDAVDYLIKPVEPDMLQVALDRINKRNREKLLISRLPANKPQSGGAARIQHTRSAWKIDRIPANNQGKTILVTEADIYYAFTLHDGVYIKTESEKLLTRFSLKSLEARLEQHYFFRTHRCYLVNLHKVKEIVPFFNGTYNLIVADKEKSEVPVSRAQAKKLKKILGI